MRKLAGLLGLSVCLCLEWGLAPRPAAAAGFDGRWIAEIPAQGRCNYIGMLTVVAVGDAISGELDDSSTASGRRLVSGTLGADGIGSFSVDHQFAGTIRFRDNRFEATWGNANCTRHAAGDRAPDTAQLEVIAAERKQRQATYADEVRRAKAGQAVDYTQMRADAVYTTDWQYFDGKAKNLLLQADAAVKGKDCAQAMPVLDQVVDIEFTNDSAHALRAQCLRQSGDADKARLEDDIAKGLTHSLMDGWGGPHGLTQALTAAAGSSEESAYLISTVYEEDEVLANRHIQVKTRETEIRGSNGHYYDLVHGVSITSTPGVIQSGSGQLIARPGTVDAQGRDIYFDITAFVTGRVSRRSAAQVLQAQVR
jgi:hypothetical protein